MSLKKEKNNIYFHWQFPGNFRIPALMHMPLMKIVEVKPA